MCDEWMPVVRLHISSTEFRQLPQNAGYKYEYLDDYALLSPRPKCYHARLDLQAPPRSDLPTVQGEDVRLRPMVTDDFTEMVELFAAAFHRYQPFSGLEDAARLAAAAACLEKSRSGGDGPWITEASFVADNVHGKALGAIIITLLPEGDPCDFDTFHWDTAPPDDCIVRRLGQPHLTWIFVAPLLTASGLGTALLRASTDVLRQMRFPHLLSTFMSANHSSMLWHWRSGFELLSYPGSMRTIRERVRDKSERGSKKGERA
jgi:hypothetical protein